MSEWALSAEDVWFGYGHPPYVLQGVTTHIAPGGLVGILGPNGSGKTTLLRLLGGLLIPSRGRVLLGGEELRTKRRNAVARQIAIVPQETQLAFEYTVLEMALMGRYPHLGAFEVEGPADVDLARAALEATGTRQLESRYFNTLSGGEKQRVVIAAALSQLALGGPEHSILLLDEPTSSLDLAYQLEIRSILRALNRDRRLTIVVSTHDLNFAGGLCDELVLLDSGQVLATGRTESMLEPELIRELYGVEVGIATHPATGRRAVIPVARLDRRP